MMNKLVLVGHPGSKYQIVEHFLKEIGMNSPNYSTSNKISQNISPLHYVNFIKHQKLMM